MAKKVKQAAKTILQDPITNFRWYMCYGGSFEDAYKWYNKFTGITIDTAVAETALGMFVYAKASPRECLIWVYNKAKVCTISHEVAHAVIHVCNTLNIPIDVTNEYFCDYTSSLNLEMVNLYYKYRGKK